MGTPALHLWTINPAEAIRIQDGLRSKLIPEWDGRPVHAVAGIDLGYTQASAIAAIAVFSYPHLAQLEVAAGEAPLVFPYIPGLLAFRVIPAILVAFEKLTQKPDLLLVHGHGIAHPRGLGLASHLGLWLNLPAIGIAKSRLYGRAAEVGQNKGDWSDLLDESDACHTIGAVVRTRLNAQPVYVSPGHMIDLPHTIEFVLSCCGGYRMPEPIRSAHAHCP
ncbi:MAG TPA: endonuclease V [Anaerolineales bacterium]